MNIVVWGISIFLTGFSAFGVQTSVAGQETFPSEQVLAEIERSWDKATTTADRSEQDYQFFDLLKGGIPIRHEKVKVARSGSSYVWSRDILEFDDPKNAFDCFTQAVNSKYEFELKKPPIKKDWLLRDWKMNGEEKANYGNPVQYMPENLAHFAHVTLGQDPLHRVFRSLGWKLLSVAPAPDNPSLIRVTFTHTKELKKNFLNVRAGWIDLDPDAAWCIRRTHHTYDIKAPNYTNNTMGDVNFAYRMGREGVPVLESSSGEMKELSPAGEVTRQMKWKMTYATEYMKEVPETEFTMSAFGLPEPQGVVWTKPTPMYVWILAAAAGCAALAVVFRLLARRTKFRPAV